MAKNCVQMKCDQEELVERRFGEIRDSEQAGISRAGGWSVLFQNMGWTSMALPVWPESLQAAPANLGRVTEYCQCPFAYGGNNTSHSTEQPIGYRRCKCKMRKRADGLVADNSCRAGTDIRGESRACQWADPDPDGQFEGKSEVQWARVAGVCCHVLSWESPGRREERPKPFLPFKIVV
jgi:hypothetical protein